MAAVDNADWTTDVTAVAAGDMSDLPDWTWAEVGAGSSGGGGGGGGGFNPNTPATITGLSAWWDAYQLAGLADNTAVAAWPDMSGAGNTLTQATAGLKPTYYSTTAGKTVNGHPAVWFNGANSLRTTTFPSLAVPWTVFAVAQQTSAAAAAMLFHSNSPTDYAQNNATLSGTWTISAGGSYTSTLTSGLALHMAVLGFNSGHLFLWQDAVKETGVAAATNALAGTVAMGSFYDTTNPYWNGPICEMAVYAGALSDAAVGVLHGYAQAKWGTP